MNRFSVLVWTEGLNASQCMRKDKGYNVIGVNVFLRELIRFNRKKVNSVPTILLLFLVEIFLFQIKR